MPSAADAGGAEAVNGKAPLEPIKHAAVAVAAVSATAAPHNTQRAAAKNVLPAGVPAATILQQQQLQQQQQQQAAAAPKQTRPREDAQTVYVQGTRYTKLECVGRGGSSKVFKVRDMVGYRAACAHSLACPAAALLVTPGRHMCYLAQVIRKRLLYCVVMNNAL
jgi:hypothetical protein